MDYFKFSNIAMEKEFLSLRSIERKKRIEAERKLESLEKHLSEAKSVDARIIYQSYFAPPVDHTGDGFIDGDE